ncbi:MAG: ArnT family glycosyltransferase [Patescibacteria group bacterium]
MRSFKNWLQNHLTYCLLAVILVAALFLRIYKLDQLLGFYYDQGRDALVVWRLIHEGKFFLVGPVTGIEGVFLGPFYYYLIAPFYFLGGGSPVFVAAVLNLFSVFGIYLLYLVAKEFFDRKVAVLGSFFVAFSYSLVVFSRWLSHPPLLPTFSLLIIYAFLQIYRGQEKWWLGVGLIEGLCLQLEAAAAVFFLPTILIFYFWQRKRTNFLIIAASLLLFLLTLAPQIIFNWRHQGILQETFRKFLVSEKSFSLPLFELARQRLVTYFDVSFSRFFYAQKNLSIVWFLTLLVLGFLKRREIFTGERRILAFWLLVPLAGYLFYQGNYGYFWDYYLSGVWLVFIILVAFLLVSFWPKIWGKLIFFLFLASFLYVNFAQFLIYYRIGIGIILRDQLAAIDWIYQDAKSTDFNVDIYVPPVIPYAYDYLFKWYGTGKHGQEPLEKRTSLLYTLYEIDSSHPERLESWLTRQKGIGKTIYEKSFGGVTVQRRERMESK